jgi:hypothetical protein
VGSGVVSELEGVPIIVKCSKEFWRAGVEWRIPE